MIYYYGNELSPNQIETVEGFLICQNVPIARTGNMEYRASDLGLEGDQNKIITVYRDEAEVFEPAALASFEGKPVTDEHPPEEVKPENFAAYSKGHVQNIRRDGDFVVADLYINDPTLMSEVKNGIKREVSCGYVCTYVADGNIYRQTKIRGNHVAVVPRGRAGHEVSIKDSINNQTTYKGGSKMGKFTKELLKVFGAAAKDAEAQELEEMAATTASVLDAGSEEGTAEQKEEEKATENKDELTGNIETKLDRVIDMLGNLIGNNEKHEEEKLSDENDIDNKINEISGEASGVISANDTAIADILKKVRPAIASIEDRNERAKVTDAILSAIKGEDKVAEIVNSAKDSAKSGLKKSYEDICKTQKETYDSLNPHKNKEAR